jgi:hypothetical protein
LSYWLDVPWFGPAPVVVHGVSLVLWVLALWLVYGVLRALDIAPGVAALATLAVGVHPVQVEAVSWATGRKDVLALLFSAASLLAHLNARTAWDRRAWLSRALYVLALLSKTTALPLPLLMVLLDVHVRRVSLREALARQLPGLIAAAAVGGAVIALWRENAMLRSDDGGAALAAVRFIQTLGHQLWTAVWPASTSPIYPTLEVASWDLARSSAFVLWTLACVLSWRAGARLVFAGLVGFGLLLLPVSNLVPMYFPWQDRYLSLPLLGLALAVAGLLSLLRARGERSGALIFAVLVAALALRTIQYAGNWSSEAQLWGHAASTQPDADYAWIKLGEVRRDAGDVEGAIRALQGAIHVAPLRKLAHAALFEAVALRDEQRRKLAPSRARQLAQQYYERMDSTASLRELSAQLLASGYLRTLELPMQIVLAREPLPDDALERVAQAQLRDGQRTLARFYAGSMRREPKDPELKALLGEYQVRVLP